MSLFGESMDKIYLKYLGVRSEHFCDNSRAFVIISPCRPAPCADPALLSRVDGQIWAKLDKYFCSFHSWHNAHIAHTLGASLMVRYEAIIMMNNCTSAAPTTAWVELCAVARRDAAPRHGWRKTIKPHQVCVSKSQPNHHLSTEGNEVVGTITRDG